MDLEALAHTTQKCSEKSRQSEKETARTSRVLTRARPGTGGGGWRVSRDAWASDNHFATLCPIEVIIRGPS